MAQLNQTFDIQDLPQGSASFDPLPAGWYTCAITGAEVKVTKAGNGQYIAMRYDITGPTHQGRVVFGNINVRNPNPKAEEIGRQNLGDIMRAIGLARVSDTDQLIGGKLQIKLEVKDDPTYGPGNEVKGYKALPGAFAAATAPASGAPAVQQPPAPPAKAAPPWAAKR